MAKQGCKNVSNIGGAPIHLDQSFIESMQLLVPKITDVGTFPLYLWPGEKICGAPPVPTTLRNVKFENFRGFLRNSRIFSKFENENEGYLRF